MNKTDDILTKALAAARASAVSVIVVASTTGATAVKLSSMAGKSCYRIIVVAHNLNRGGERFEKTTAAELADKGITVFRQPDKSVWPKMLRKFMMKFGYSSWRRKLKDVKAEQGTGICVCYKIVRKLMKSGILQSGEVIAIAGKKQGADSAGIFVIPRNGKWPILKRVVE